jgi:hypothetical protein
MKKAIISLSIVIILTSSTLSCVATSKPFEINKTLCKFCDQFESTDFDFSSYYESFVGSYGIKIWAKGYGTFDCTAFEDEGDRWSQTVRYPEDMKPLKYYNLFSYTFYDSNAETKVNFLMPIGPMGISLIIMIIFPNLFRFNLKIPPKGPGPHSTEGKGALFQGYIKKGQTFEDEPVDPIYINGTLYHYYELRGRCTYLPLVSEAEFGDLSFILKNALQWKNDPNFIPWDCCAWN